MKNLLEEVMQFYFTALLTSILKIEKKDFNVTEKFSLEREKPAKWTNIELDNKLGASLIRNECKTERLSFSQFL